LAGDSVAHSLSSIVALLQSEPPSTVESLESVADNWSHASFSSSLVLNPKTAQSRFEYTAVYRGQGNGKTIHKFASRLRRLHLG
jgi:hypothetical protein